MAQWVNRLRNNIFVNPLPLPLLCEISGALHLAQPGLMAGWLADEINTGEFRVGQNIQLVASIDRKSYGFRKNSRFKNQPCNRLYPKKPAGMHW